jgi:predicted nuclease with TOPRIM domain
MDISECKRELNTLDDRLMELFGERMSLSSVMEGYRAEAASGSEGAERAAGLLAKAQARYDEIAGEVKELHEKTARLPAVYHEKLREAGLDEEDDDYEEEEEEDGAPAFDFFSSLPRD